MDIAFLYQFLWNTHEIEVHNIVPNRHLYSFSVNNAWPVITVIQNKLNYLEIKISWMTKNDNDFNITYLLIYFFLCTYQRKGVHQSLD